MSSAGHAISPGSTFPLLAACSRTDIRSSQHTDPGKRVSCEPLRVFSFNESQYSSILAKKVNEPLLKVGARKSEAAFPATNGLGITSPRDTQRVIERGPRGGKSSRNWQERQKCVFLRRGDRSDGV